MASGANENLTVSAYKSLRAAIVTCALRPNEKLVINDLCRDLGVSLGAVREALSRLVAEGLVVSVPQKGFTVSPVSQADLDDLTRVRKIIERECLISAITNGGIKWESGIVAAHHELAQLPLKDPDEPGRINEAWRVAHGDFHLALVSACDSPWLLRMRDVLYLQSERYRRLSVIYDREDRDVAAEHEELADAVIKRNADKAVRLMMVHMSRTAQIVRAGVNEQEKAKDRLQSS